jgi:hypothetical protein
MARDDRLENVRWQRFLVARTLCDDADLDYPNKGVSSTRSYWAYQKKEGLRITDGKT